MSPALRQRVRRSALSATCAKSAAKNGVEALRMAASPEVIWRSPQGISTNGAAVAKKATTTRSPQRRLAGSRLRRAATSARMSAAPPPSRSHATATGPTSSSITLMNMNDAPHISESAAIPIR